MEPKGGARVLEMLEADAQRASGAAGAGDESRPDPEPLHRAVPPSAPYPVDALGPILGGAARAIHDVVRSPLALCGSSVLAAGSLAVQAHADVVCDGRRVLTTLWLLTVAESGERKSATDAAALAPHEVYEREEMARLARAHAAHRTDFEAWEAARAKAKNVGKSGGRAEIAAALAACGPAPVPPPSGLLRTREPTMEGIQKLYLGGTSTLGLFSDEGAEFFGGHAMSKDHAMRTIGGLSALWDSGTSDRVRAGDGAAKINGRRLAMHMLMQPVIAERVLGDALLAGQGFLARTLIAWPDTTAGTRLYQARSVADEPAMLVYAARMSEILRRPLPTKPDAGAELAPRALGLTPQAKAAWRVAYDSYERELRPGGTFAAMRAWGSKAADQVLRIAGALAMVESPDAVDITAEQVERAAALTRWYLDDMRRVLESATVPPDVRAATAVLAWCREKRSAIVSARRLMQFGPRPVREAKALGQAMGVLVDAGWAVVRLDVEVEGRKVRRAWELRLDVPDPEAGYSGYTGYLGAATA